MRRSPGRSSPFLLATLTASLVLAACGGTVVKSSTGTAAADGLVDAVAAQADLDAALKDTPVPPGVSFHLSLGPRNGSYQPGYGRALVQQAAICAWFQYWIGGLTRNDGAAIQLASRTLALVTGWDTYTSADQSFRDLIDAAISKTTLGDPGQMRSYVANNCPSA